MISQATYIGSFSKISECPNIVIPEFAFIGRSNVGKSSLINLITQRKDLAKTSQTPGKTQKINYFLINERWHLVDLPGYGYAKVSKTMRTDFNKMIRNFLEKRESLYCVFLLIDGSIPPQKIDIEFANWLGEKQIPFVLVFTKSDKAKQLEVSKYIKLFITELGQTWKELPPYYLTSAKKQLGYKELMSFITSVIESNQ